MTRWNIPATTLVLAVALAGCQEDVAAPAVSQPADQGPQVDERTGPPAETMPTPAEAEQRPMITVSDSEHRHLVDAAGQALYVLEGNQDGSRCDEACENAWPPVQAEETQALAGTGVVGELGTMPRADGGLHVTYDGQPLYRYAADTGVGATAGHGVQDQWGTWTLAGPGGAADPDQ